MRMMNSNRNPLKTKPFGLWSNRAENLYHENETPWDLAQTDATYVPFPTEERGGGSSRRGSPAEGHDQSSGRGDQSSGRGSSCENRGDLSPPGDDQKRDSASNAGSILPTTQ